MKGILMKDLYIAKSNIFVAVLSLIAIGLGLSALLEPSAMLTLGPAVTTVTVFLSIVSDSSSKWSKNVIAMPVSRRQIVGEKFLFYVLLAALGLLASLLCCGALALFDVAVTSDALLLYGVIGGTASLFAGSFSLPYAFLFDPEKAEIFFIVSYLASTGIITALILFLNLFFPVKDHTILAFTLVFVLSALFYFGAYRAAARLYQTRDVT